MKPGDIVWVAFPFAEGGTKERPALVLDVMETMGGAVQARVAYGTSQKTTTSSLLPAEFTISPSDGESVMASSGFRVATKFDLRKTAVMAVNAGRRIGVVHPCLLSRFFRAAKEANLV